MRKYKMFWCFDFCNGELMEEFAVDDEKTAYEFFRSAEDPVVIYGVEIKNLTDFKEIKDETETKIL